MFNTWENQVHLLKNTYELSDEETKVMISRKVKGKAQRWFHSSSNHLNQTVEIGNKEGKTIITCKRRNDATTSMQTGSGRTEEHNTLLQLWKNRTYCDEMYET